MPSFTPEQVKNITEHLTQQLIKTHIIRKNNEKRKPDFSIIPETATISMNCQYPQLAIRLRSRFKSYGFCVREASPYAPKSVIAYLKPLHPIVASEVTNHQFQAQGAISLALRKKRMKTADAVQNFLLDTTLGTELLVIAKNIPTRASINTSSVFGQTYRAHSSQSDIQRLENTFSVTFPTSFP